ncbi:MAG: ABC transporter permease [Verrucomicrobiota bacterium]
MKLENLVEAYFLKLRFNLKSEASKSYLNYAWWILEPALHVAVFYFVFNVMLDRGGPNFTVFLLCGQIPFLWLSRSVNNATGSILYGRGMILQISIPKPFFPLLAVGQDLVKQSTVFLCLLLFLILVGFGPSAYWFYLPAIIIVQAMLVCALALVAAAITPYVPDFRFLVNTGMTMLMFASGIFYDYRTVLKDEHKQWFLLNPMSTLIECYRDVLIRHQPLDWNGLLFLLLGSLVLLILVLGFYKRHDAAYARLVAQ